jgi:tRNA(Ile)-lysidine synthase
MASLKKLPKSNLAKGETFSLLSQIKLFLKDFFRSNNLVRPKLLVAYSGGLDSTVLLHVLHQLQAEISFHLSAMHVHHGLSDYADDWARFCDKTCSDLGVPIKVSYVHVHNEDGLGIEAAARHARYSALNAAPVDYICLGHHQDDQAETFLLQLARGAGVKGLAGMGQVDVKRRLLRPFLNTPRLELVSYAKQNQLQWVDDESNEDVKFDRNFIRHEVIPTFSKRYASIRKTLARSALHMADANTMLDDLAQLDAEKVIDKNQCYGAIRLEGLNGLSQARQANLIRMWLSVNQVHMPSAALLQQILQQLHSTRSDAAIKVKVNAGLYIMRYNKMAHLVRELKPLLPLNLLWQGEEVVTLPNQSQLFFTKKMGEGLAYQRGGTDIKLRIKWREGGEYFRPELGRPRRSLKYIMQSRKIPPWLREQLPLIFMDETLVMIPNVGIDAEMKAADHEMGLTVNWEPVID